MIDFIKTYIKYFLLSRWNKISTEGLELLENHWKNKPTTGPNAWLYKQIKRKNENILR